MPLTVPTHSKTNNRPNGFNRQGQVARVLKEFDQTLSMSVQDTLKLERTHLSRHLSRKEKEEKETELRKQALPNEAEFEYKLAKAYRKDYGQPIPSRYLKQVVRSVKNMLERVRFYTYSPAFIPIADYAPPITNKPAGKKFTELENKSWASISEPGDERYPGWHQSTTAHDDIAEWLEETTPCPSEKNEDVSESESNRTKRNHSQDSLQSARKRPSLSPLEADEDGPSDNSEHTHFRPFIGSPDAEESVASFSRLFMDQDDLNDYPSAPTPQAFPLSPLDEPYVALSRYAFQNETSALQVSRAPTPGLDFREALIEAVNKQPRSTHDIVHYFNLAHQGRPEQKARALFRLGKAFEQGREIDIDQYLSAENAPEYPDSGPPSRCESPVQVFNTSIDDTDDETQENRGRSSSGEYGYKKHEPREESRQRMIQEFQQVQSSGLGDTQLNDLRFPFYNRKRLPLTGKPTPRVKPQGEIPGREIRKWVESEMAL